MKTVTFVFLLLASVAARAQSATLPVDVNKSGLKWTGHAEVGGYAPAGTLKLRSGEIDMKNGAFAGATLVIDMTTLQQDNAELTHHLKSADFFDVDQYPISTIRIERVSGGMVNGTLTIKDKTAPFQAPVHSAVMNGRFTVSGSVTLNRTVYGIVYNSPSFFSGLGNKAIRNTFEVEFTIAGQGELPPQYQF